FKDDHELYVYPNLRYIGIELWQVKLGTLFDNILVSNDLEYAKKLAKEIWGKNKYANIRYMVYYTLKGASSTGRALALQA
ncbi:hypothetical protein SUGI_0124550, partial [Cryptomeria japonica]